MPLYEYECFVCGFRFEKIQKVSAEPLKTCPECGGAVRRLMGVPALQFKGSGWYVTDYGKGNGGASSRSTERESAPKKTESASSTDAGKEGSSKEKVSKAS